MKIKLEHDNHMKERMAKIADKMPAHRARLQDDQRIKDMDMRIRWDWLWGTGLSSWVSVTLYPYLNNTHIDMALKSIVKEITSELPIDTQSRGF